MMRRAVIALAGALVLVAGSLFVATPAHAVWGDWVEVPGGGRTSDAPAVTTTSDGTTWVFVRGTTGGVNRIYFHRLTPSGWEGAGWREVPGNGFTLSAPAVASDTGQGMFDGLTVVVRGTDNRVWRAKWYRYYNTWSSADGWDIQVENGGTPSAPTILWNRSRSRYEVYVRQSNNRIYRCYFETCNTWTEVAGNGTTPSAPAATWWPNSERGILVVRGSGGDNRLWYTEKTYDFAFGDHGWTTWHPSFTTETAPAVAKDQLGNTDVFARGANREVYHVHPHSYYSLGRTTDSAPAATYNSRGLCVFIRALDERIMYRCNR